jgi:hypothetical protein
MQVDKHNIPKFGGNLQLKLWADGNKWWSGHPSSTTVTMSVKSVIAYFNTSGTEDGTDEQWFSACAKAGGASDKTICEAYAESGRNDDLPITAHGVPPSQTSTAHPATDSALAPVDDISTESADGTLTGPARNPNCMANHGPGQAVIHDPCPGQAARNQNVALAVIQSFVINNLSKLRARFPPAYSESDAFSSNHSSCNGPEQCVLDPLGPGCHPLKSQAARIQPFGLAGAQNHLGKVLSKLKTRGLLPCTEAADLPKRQSPNNMAEECVFNLLGPYCTTAKSQAVHSAAPPWLAVLKYFSEQIRLLQPRDIPHYSLPFGSPVEEDSDTANKTTAAKSPAVRLQPPRWLSTLHAMNSTPPVYKAFGGNMLSGLKTLFRPRSLHTQADGTHDSPKEYQSGTDTSCEFDKLI